MFKITAAAVALTLLATGAIAQGLSRVDIGAVAPAFSVAGADGGRHALRDYRGKVVILEWMSPACPYTEAKYKDGTMQDLQAKARAKGMVWLSVNTSRAGKPGYLTPKAALERAKAQGATPTAILLDNGGALGRLYGARATPSFFIVGKDGKLAYQGAIDDDKFARGEATKNHVAEAVDDLAAGRAVAISETRPYGCPVEY